MKGRGQSYNQRPFVADTDWRLRRRHELIERLRAFERAHKRAPTSPELGCGAKEERVRELPTYNTLVRHFGSVANAMKEAGLTARSQGDRIRSTKRGASQRTKVREAAAKQQPIPDVKPARTIQFHTDFLLALPEARAELARYDSQQVRFYVKGAEGKRSA